MLSRLTRIAAVLSAAVLTTLLAAGIASADPSGTDVSEIDPLSGPPCAVGHLCVFEGPNYTGDRVDLYYCGLTDLRAKEPKLDRMGSFINNQTDSAVAHFFRSGRYGQPVYEFSSIAVDARADTTATPIQFADPC